MLASYDKLVKHLVEKFQIALSPLGEITKNQEIIIAQNKQLIDLLSRMYADREIVVEEGAALATPETSNDDAEASEA